MEKIVHYDIVALVLVVILLFSTIFRKLTRGGANHTYLFVLITAVASTVFDIWAIVMDNMVLAGSSISDVPVYISHSLYLLTHNLTVPAYLLYLIGLTDTWHKFRKSVPMLIVLSLPYAVIFLMVALNPFTKLLFTVENGVYEHGDMFMLMYICAAASILMCVICLVRMAKLLSLTKLLSLGAVVVLSVAAMLGQMFAPTVRTEMIAKALGLLFISMTVHRPEDIIDSFTGLRKYGAYADDMKRAFANNKHSVIVMMNVANFVSLQTMISYDDTTNLLKLITSEIIDIDKRIKGHADLYYLDRGRFRIVFPAKDSDKAEAYAALLNGSMKSKFSISGFDLNLTAFVLLARCPEDIGDFRTLMTFGTDFHDRLHYSGRVIQVSDVYDPKRFEVMNHLDAIIDNALAQGHFRVYYQPIYSVNEQRFVSAEALLRLIDDVHGFIPPDIFIPAAEKSGAIHKIGEYVLESVCSFIASEDFKSLGLDYIEINLSVAQCMHSDLADMVLHMLKKYNVPSDKINLEITETAVSYSQQIMSDNLQKLSSAGISFSLDDYGTGYSNMKRVIQLPLKIVKLDKSFVDEQNNPKMWIVLQNTIKMLKDMNMEIVVEGIETQDMVEQFSALRCDFIQGYYYSKPIPQRDFVEFIQTHASGS